MENKNNGQGIFYGVIGVATLVVAIIGATFAYFSATANSDPAEITASSGSVSLTWNDSGAKGLKTNLVPVAAEEKASAFKRYPGITGDDCIDDVGNAICSTFEFTVGNPSGNPAQRVYATLTPTQNSFHNLKFAIFKGSVTDLGDNFDLSKTVPAAPSETKKNTYGGLGDLVHAAEVIPYDSTAAIDLDLLEQVIDGGDSVTYTMVLWLHEAGEDNEDDQNANFAGGIKFTTGDGSGVTGVISAS